jgi:hypothetical protein
MRYADIILPEEGFNEAGVDLITGKILSVLDPWAPGVCRAEGFLGPE